MKALVVGCGAIGCRHVKNLAGLTKVKEIFIYTKVKNCLKEFAGSRKVKLIEKLEGAQADLAVISNETAKHIETALLLARQGINLFIEKPLAPNLCGVEQLRDVVNSKGLKLAVGYNLRFLGAIEYIKKILAGGALGKLSFAKIEAGQYLPDWRKNIDYRNSYSAFSARGGGVGLDLSHELDYMCYLFGWPREWKALSARAGKLEIDSDDVFEGIYRFADDFICNVHLDYLQPKKREIRIVASRGRLSCDLVKGKITVQINNKEKAIRERGLFNLNKTYIDELNDFISAIEKDRQPKVTLDDGIRALMLLEEKNV